MTDQKTTKDETADDQPVDDTAAAAASETGAETGAEIGANGATPDEVLNDVIAAASATTADAADPQDPLAAMIAERDQLKDQLLRALADTENMRRRSEREAANVRKYGHTPFARDLVGAIDNLARVVDSAPDDLDQVDEAMKSLITGIQLSWTELQTVIEKHGIKRVQPLGEKFDYNFHQAMFEVPTNDQPSGVVLDVVQHGYVLHDRLLRPAMVGVSKAGDAAGTTDGDAPKTDK